MKHFGEKSLSSILHRVAQVSWILLIPCALVACVLLLFALFQIDFGDPLTSAIQAESMRMSADPDWQRLMGLPLVGKAFLLPYILLVTFLVFKILRTSQVLFDNFQKNIVFRSQNVGVLTGLNKYMIALAVIMVSPLTLLVCVILHFVTKILQEGSVLQDEHDFLSVDYDLKN